MKNYSLLSYFLGVGGHLMKIVANTVTSQDVSIVDPIKQAVYKFHGLMQAKSD